MNHDHVHTITTAPQPIPYWTSGILGYLLCTTCVAIILVQERDRQNKDVPTWQLFFTAIFWPLALVLFLFDVYHTIRGRNG